MALIRKSQQDELIQRSRSNLTPSIQAQSSEADEHYLYLDPQDLGLPIPDSDYPIREEEEVEQYSLYTPAHPTFRSLLLPPSSTAMSQYFTLPPVSGGNFW